MLAIRLQRLGRKDLAVYRLMVQESSRHPSSGRVVAYVGSYNPHTKEVKLDAEKIGFYLKNGAQPTPRVVKLLVEQKVELPSWVKMPRTDKTLATRNPEKLRKNQPAEAKVEDQPAETEAAAETEQPAEATAEAEKAESTEE